MDFNDCNCLGDVKLKQELLQLTSICEDELLYHYTSQQGLEGILQNRNIDFRFTRMDCLNDITEGNGIIEYYKNACKELLQSEEIGKDYFELIISVLPLEVELFIYDDIIENVKLKTGSVAEFISYVFSFSSSSDSLPMWNYYLKNAYYDGYNLGFSPSKLKERFHYHPFKCGYLSEFIVVEYDKCEKDDIIKDYLRALYAYRCEDDAELSETKEAISRELSKWRYSFKEDSFSHEKEVRLVIKVPLNDDKTEFAPFFKNELRYNKEDKIPKYISASVYDKMALSEITLAPSADENKLKKLLLVLEDKGYDVKVNFSKIPVRF